MNRKLKTQAISRAEARERLRRAKSYLELASLNLDSDSNAQRSASVANSVLSAIASADAICGFKLGKYSVAPDHQQATLLLEEAIPHENRLLNSFQRLLHNKTASQYGHGTISRNQTLSSYSAAEALMRKAQDLLLSEE